MLSETFRSFFLGALLAACSSARGVPTVELPSEPPAEEVSRGTSTLRIGAYLSLSGPGRRRSIEMKEGIELAVAEINEAGGIKGRPLEIEYTDDQTNPSLVTNRVVELINIRRVVALLGDVSAQSMSGATLADKSRIPIIAPFSAEPEVTAIGPFVFRACAAEDAQARP